MGLADYSKLSDVYFRNNDYLPSRKTSISIYKVIEDSIKPDRFRGGKVMMGRSIKINNEITLPFFS